MPRTTLATLQRQIDKLQLQAERLKAKEVPGVIERIRAAVDYYQLTPKDLFPANHSDSAGTASGKAIKSQKPSSKSSTTKKPAAKKKASTIRFRDEHGNTWTGHGQRPRWFLHAIANGKTREDLSVGS
jgi:DNA-binding protein H-NS